MDRVMRLPILKSPPAKITKQMTALAKQVNSLQRLLCDSPDSTAIQLRLIRGADHYAQNTQPFGNLKPVEMFELKDGVELTTVNFRGEEKVAEIVGAISTLAKIIDSTNNLEFSKGKKYVGNPDLLRLFRAIGAEWSRATTRPASIGWNAHKEIATGPYLVFLRVLLCRMVSKIPKGLDEIIPDFRKSLKLTDDAIRSRVKEARPAEGEAAAKK